jgi:hypothetical protein
LPLENGYGVNMAENLGSAPLNMACKKGDLSVTQMLIGLQKG